MILASVVSPDPGGPQKMHEPISPRRISSPRGFPGASSCSWRRNSSKVPGRILAAKGSPARWNSVGSDTGCPLPGCGMRDAGCVKTALRCRNRVVSPPSAQPRFTDVRKLDRLDAWRTAQELAYQAYLLTLSPQLSRHFALTDQIRRAALSVPANIAEGYSLGTTPQFLRGLKIALGSNAELYSHLTVLARLDLLATHDVRTVIDLCNRVIAMIIGLIRKLSLRAS